MDSHGDRLDPRFAETEAAMLAMAAAAARQRDVGPPPPQRRDPGSGFHPQQHRPLGRGRDSSSRIEPRRTADTPDLTTLPTFAHTDSLGPSRSPHDPPVYVIEEGVHRSLFTPEAINFPTPGAMSPNTSPTDVNQLLTVSLEALSRKLETKIDNALDVLQSLVQHQVALGREVRALKEEMRGVVNGIASGRVRVKGKGKATVSTEHATAHQVGGQSNLRVSSSSTHVRQSTNGNAKPNPDHPRSTSASGSAFGLPEDGAINPPGVQAWDSSVRAGLDRVELDTARQVVEDEHEHGNPSAFFASGSGTPVLGPNAQPVLRNAYADDTTGLFDPANGGHSPTSGVSNELVQARMNGSVTGKPRRLTSEPTVLDESRPIPRANSAQDALRQWYEPDPSIGLALPLREWPLAWYRRNPTAASYSQRRRIAQGYAAVTGGDEYTIEGVNAFVQRYGAAYREAYNKVQEDLKLRGVVKSRVGKKRKAEEAELAAAGQSSQKRGSVEHLMEDDDDVGPRFADGGDDAMGRAGAGATLGNAGQLSDEGPQEDLMVTERVVRLGPAQ